MLEIGLGDTGGTRMLWRQIFSNVVTVEIDPRIAQMHIDEMGKDPLHPLVVGNSTDPGVVSLVHAVGAPYDALFIDGDHLADGVYRDWINYSPMVRPGGIVAFHDTAADVPGHLAVHSLMAQLKAGGLPLVDIHHSAVVGISYYRVAR